MHCRKKKQILMGLMSENERAAYLELLEFKAHTVIEAAEWILFCREHRCIKPRIEKQSTVRGGERPIWSD